MDKFTGLLLIFAGLILVISGHSQPNVGILALYSLLGLGISVVGYKLGGFND